MARYSPTVRPLGPDPMDASNALIAALEERDARQRDAELRAREEARYQQGRKDTLDERRYQRGRDKVADSRFEDERTYRRGRDAREDDRRAAEFAIEAEIDPRTTTRRPAGATMNPLRPTPEANPLAEALDEDVPAMGLPGQFNGAGFNPAVLPSLMEPEPIASYGGVDVFSDPTYRTPETLEREKDARARAREAQERESLIAALSELDGVSPEQARALGLGADEQVVLPELRPRHASDPNQVSRTQLLVAARQRAQDAANAIARMDRPLGSTQRERYDAAVAETLRLYGFDSIDQLYDTMRAFSLADVLDDGDADAGGSGFDVNFFGGAGAGDPALDEQRAAYDAAAAALRAQGKEPSQVIGPRP